jgi:hypothetical protein
MPMHLGRTGYDPLDELGVFHMLFLSSRFLYSLSFFSLPPRLPANLLLAC